MLAGKLLRWPCSCNRPTSKGAVRKLQPPLGSPGGLVRNAAEPLTDAAGLGWGLKVCISNSFLGAAAALGQETTLGESLHQGTRFHQPLPVFSFSF